MTVTNTTVSETFLGSGSVGPFTFTFRFFLDSDIVVNRTTNGITTTLVKNAGYTLSGAGTYTGGSVTLTSALAVGETLIISRTLPLTQTTSIRNLGAFYPNIHEDEFDRLVMMIQQVNALATTNSIVAQTGTATSRSLISSDASAAPTTVDLTGLTSVSVFKTDATANTVTIIDSSGKTILRQGSYTLYGLDEWVTLDLVGGDWKRTG